MKLQQYMFRACVYPSSDEKGRFIAHCLELDVIGEGGSVEEAMNELLEAIDAQMEACEETGAQVCFFARRRFGSVIRLLWTREGLSLVNWLIV